MKIPVALLLAIPLLVPPTALALVDDEAAGEELSLEELLERYRAERDQLLEAFRGQVEKVVANIESAYDKGGKQRDDLEKYRRELSGLGPAATPLLVKYIDPGVAAEDPAKGRARQMTTVLSGLSTRSVTSELLEILSRGSIEGRRNAVRVLGSSDDPLRVGPVLRQRYSEASASEKADLLAAVARLGGSENDAFVAAILADKDPRVVGLALKALTEEKIQDAQSQILELVKTTQAAAPQVPGILGYYRACPAVVDDDHCEALAALARSLVSNSEAAVSVLELLTEFQDEWSSKIKKEFKQLSSSADHSIAEAALIGLARAGDRSAKKKLLEPYDDRIDNNIRLAVAWENRANVRYKIADYKSAIKDYQEALRAGEQYGRTQPEVYIGVARCYARLGKLKDAYDWLDDAPLSIVMLRALAKEPVFQEMVEHPKYKKVFHLKDD